MYHRIVVPLDGTAFSECALPYAIQLAERSGANLELCHVHVHQDRNPDFAALTPYQFQHCVDAEYDFDATATARETEALEEVAARVRAQTSAVVTTRTLTGRVDSVIVDPNGELPDVNLKNNVWTSGVAIGHRKRRR